MGAHAPQLAGPFMPICAALALIMHKMFLQHISTSTGNNKATLQFSKSKKDYLIVFEYFICIWSDLSLH